MDPACLRAHCRAVVLAAEYPVFLVGAGRDRALLIRALAVARDRTRGAPVPRDHRAFPVGLSRAPDLEFSLSRTTLLDDMAGRRPAPHPGLLSHGRAGGSDVHYSFL